MYESFVCIYGGQRRVSYPPDLELGMIVSHRVGAGNWTQAPCKDNKRSEWLSRLYSLQDHMCGALTQPFFSIGY